MSFQKSQINFKLLLTFTLLGLICSQMTIPLKIDGFENLYFEAVFGDQQCSTNISILDIYCPNIEIFQSPETTPCFSNSIGHNTASFIFGNQLSNLSYSSYAIQYSLLCIGYDQTESKASTLSQLVSQKLVPKQKIFFNLNLESVGDGDNVGVANIGSPNYSYIKRGVNLVQLKRDQQFDQNYAVFNQGLKFFGKNLDSKNVFFTLDSFHGFTREAFLQMIKIFEKNDIPHIFERNEDFQVYEVYLPSIEKLQPFELSLLLEDNTIYPLTLQVSQYTRKLDNGQYQLTIKALFNTYHMELSYDVFKTHYVGFDQSNGTIEIAEKSENQIYLRGSHYIVD